MSTDSGITDSHIASESLEEKILKSSSNSDKQDSEFRLEGEVSEESKNENKNNQVKIENSLKSDCNSEDTNKFKDKHEETKRRILNRESSSNS